MTFTRDTFHNSQILLSNKVLRYASWSSHVIFGSAIAVSLSTFIPSHISQCCQAFGFGSTYIKKSPIAS
jgi:hypothetical protein